MGEGGVAWVGVHAKRLRGGGWWRERRCGLCVDEVRSGSGAIPHHQPRILWPSGEWKANRSGQTTSHPRQVF